MFRSICATAAVALLVVATAAGQAAAAGSVTYTATQTIPVPPASTYAGSGGGDGWAVALGASDVFNVFHHSSAVTVACHSQSDASECWTPRTISAADGASFSSTSQPGLWLDPVSERLYTFATRNTDFVGGVVCIDTKVAGANPNPFCGFTALTGAGESPTAIGWSQISAPVMVSGRWYAFNYAAGATGAANKLLCFDTSAMAACPSQPFSLDLGQDPVSPSYSTPSVGGIGGRVIVPVTGTTERLACFDANTGQECAGSWPAPADGFAGNYGAPYPMLNNNGGATGFCLPTGTDPCYDLSGGTVVTPAGMTSTLTGSSPWNGPPVTLGPRIYVPHGGTDVVECYDYSTNSSCPNFPKALPNLGYLYTVNPDPQRPTCLWVNADGGSAQIQNFDAYSAGACGQGPIRILASSFVVNTIACQPAAYTSLQVTDPPRSSYTSGTVAFQDGNANPIVSAADRPLDAAGLVDLSGLNLSTTFGLPQFLITLNGSSSTPGAVTVKLTWTGTDDPSCVKPGTTTSGGSGSAFVAMGDSFSAGEGNAPYFASSDTSVNTCHRSPVAYAPKLSQLHWTKPPTPKFVACSGAITDDVFNPNRESNLIPDPSTGHYMREPAQSDALTQETKLVTLTIGGNDVGFAEVLEKCVSNPGLGNPHCQSTGLAKSVSNRIDALKGIGSGTTGSSYPIHSWAKVIQKVHEKAPNARILIAGYPVLVSAKNGYVWTPGGQYCTVGGLTWFGHSVGWRAVIYKDAAAWMAGQVASVNKGLKDAVTASGVKQAAYVDVASAFSGHALCDSEPWIYPISGNTDFTTSIKDVWSGSFHPTAKGQMAYETAFARALG